MNIRRGLRLFSLFILFQSQSALRNTFYIGAVGKTIPTIQLGNDLSATVLRYLRLQEQKQLVETRVKTLDAEIQRLKGRIVAKLNISCMAMGEYVTMSESRRFSIKAKEADEAPWQRRTRIYAWQWTGTRTGGSPAVSWQNYCITTAVIWTPSAAARGYVCLTMAWPRRNGGHRDTENPGKAKPRPGILAKNIFSSKYWHSNYIMLYCVSILKDESSL